jgi:hypothetical protein
MSWFGADKSEQRANAQGDILYGRPSEYDPSGKYQTQTVGQGTTYERTYDPAAAALTGNKLAAYQAGGADYRNYMYGRTPTGADDAVNKAWNTGDQATQVGGWAGLAGNNVANQGNDLLNQRTNDAAYFNGRQTGLANANLIGNLEMNEGPSAAQAQLQQGTNQALGSQLAMARSGRGFGGTAATMQAAQGNLAGIQANQANQSAGLRAQENAAWRQRQASNMLGANSQILQSQGQNDAMVQGMTGLGQQAWGQGAGIQQQGYANQLGSYNTSVGAQGLGNQIRNTQADLGKTFEDNQLRAWAAANGYNMEDQKRKDSNDTATMAAMAALIASDVRAKKDISRSDQPATDFARGLSFDGTIYRPQGESSQVSYPELKPPDTAALDAVANAPGYGYKYIDPSAPGAKSGENYGPMAQDLAKTPAGATAVVKKPDGKLGVDPGRLTLVNTSAISAQQRQLDELQRQIQAFSAQPGAVYPTTRGPG